MKSSLSSLAVIVLLVALGLLTVVALPRGMEPATAAAPAAPLIEAAQEPAAPAATEKWNNIAVPLTVAGVATADQVANYINNNTNPPGAANSITKVAKWDSASQSLVIRNVGSPFGQPDFAVQTGDWLFVAANANSATEFTFAWVGDVPAQGYRNYAIAANGWSSLMLPLDTDTTVIQTADDLAGDMTNVTQVARWDANAQSLVIRNVGSPFGQPDFAVQIGYPYLVYATSASTWP